MPRPPTGCYRHPFVLIDLICFVLSVSVVVIVVFFFAGLCTVVPKVEDGGLVGGCRRQEEEHAPRHQEGHAPEENESEARVRSPGRGNETKTAGTVLFWSIFSNGDAFMFCFRNILWNPFRPVTMEGQKFEIAEDPSTNFD